MACMLCETNTIAAPERRNSGQPLVAFLLEAKSPTASTSSISSTSGSTCAATAKPSRAFMPDE